MFIFGVRNFLSKHVYGKNKNAQLSLTNPGDAVEIRVMDHSRASKVTPFDRSYTTSY